MVQVQITTEKLEKYRDTVLEKRQNLEGKSILVVGDIGLDEYVFGRVDRISPEAPVPILDVSREETRLGLASFVSQNVATLGGRPRLLSVVGDDGAGTTMKSLLNLAGVGTDDLIVDPDRPTTRKTRVISGQQHIVRVDYERRRFLSEKVEKELLDKAAKIMDECDGVIIQDYAKGVISENVAQKIIALSHEKGKKVLIDPNRSTPLQYYSGADIISPNRDEAMLLAGYPLEDLRYSEETLFEAGQKLLDLSNCKSLILTRGKNGMSLFDNGRITNLPTYARDVFDVVGAGDAVIASVALAQAGGYSLEESCVLANFAAGVVVAKVGCLPCYMDELVQYIEST